MSSPSLVLLRTQSDARLVALARDGHERAFEAIVERYRRQLLRACRRVLPEARAEDALQQALVAAWRGLQRGDEVRELRPWLHRIAHRTSLNTLRQTGYDYDELQESLRIADAPDDELERRAVVRQTLHGLASLPPRQREALLAIAVEGRPQDEVAADLGLTAGAVRQLVHRARTTLRTAATAVVPLPLVTWVASGSAGAGAVLAKAGTVVLLAGGAVAGPALIEKRTSGPQVPAAVQAATPRGSLQARPASLRATAPQTAPVVATAETQRTGASRRAAATTPAGPDRSGHEDGDDDASHRGRSGGGDDDRSGSSGDDGADRSGPSGDDAEDRSGPSGGGELEREDRSGPSGGGEVDREDRSGPSPRSGSSGGDDDREQFAAPTPAPQPAEEPEPDHSGPGSGGDDD